MYSGCESPVQHVCLPYIWSRPRADRPRSGIRAVDVWDCHWDRHRWLVLQEQSGPVGKQQGHNINSLAPEKCGNNCTGEFKHMLWTDVSSTSCESGFRWVLQNLINQANEKSTLVRVMAWCCQATSHYLNQCWPIFSLLYVITRPQGVNSSEKSCPQKNSYTLEILHKWFEKYIMMQYDFLTCHNVNFDWSNCPNKSYIDC